MIQTNGKRIEGINSNYFSDDLFYNDCGNVSILSEGALQAGYRPCFSLDNAVDLFLNDPDQVFIFALLHGFLDPDDLGSLYISLLCKEFYEIFPEYNEAHNSDSDSSPWILSEKNALC